MGNQPIKINRLLLTIIILTVVTTFNDLKVLAQTTEQDPEVITTNASLSVKVAPGELLPVSVKLANFGGGSKVDVLVQYEILDDSGNSIYSSNETVAVETTASFVKTIQIPNSTREGTYTARTSVVYDGQLVPATTQFTFQVELKIIGLFKSDLIIYGGITLIIGFIMAIFGYALVKKRSLTRYTPFDYSNISKDQRVFYELISDTIMQMRQRVGDEALRIAMQTKGLVIDENTGRVLEFTEKPSKVIAQLVSGYEEVLGQKVSFTLRNN